MSEGWNSATSKRTALTILKAILAPEDVHKLQYLQAVMLCGLPGSGKSTIARLLHTLYGFERFSTDQVRTEDLFPGQEHRLGKEHETVMTARYLVYEELARRVVKALAAGKRAVVDGTHLDDKRMGIMGAILSQIPSERAAFVIIRPPEWIMRRRFEHEGEEAKKHWWSIYRYWRSYMKEGKAAFPTEKMFPRVQQLRVRRYAIRTFDWVPDIKAIVWDVDGTLYKDNTALREAFDRPCIEVFAKAKKLTLKAGEKEYWRAYERLHSKTKTLESAGIDARAFMGQLGATLPYETLLSRDRRLVKMLTTLPQLKHFVLSNAGRKETLVKLAAMGVPESLFEKILVTYEFDYLKPDPRAFTTAAHKIGLKPYQILAVGDREATDIIPAKKAGMRTAFVWGVSEEADVSLKTVYEVAELFGVTV